ncbi:MAG: 16S rRNA (guanine(527)-N(7))-methyltransferase RsmG [Amaricoccus sp.]
MRGQRGDTRISGPEEFRAAFGVSRETLERLETHLALLEKWNPRINLVARGTLGDAWSRHFADSAQLWRLRPSDARRWVDLGSGAGFPGLVIAALAKEESPGIEVRLVESDQRKAAFLREVARVAGLSATVLDSRIESLPGQEADVVSARALAQLSDLLPMLEKHRALGGIGLFPKGETAHKELSDAAAHWRFEHKIYASLVEQKAVIVQIGAIDRV